MKQFTLNDFQQAADAKYGSLELTDIGVTLFNILLMPDAQAKAVTTKLKEIEALQGDEGSSDTGAIQKVLVEALSLAADNAGKCTEALVAQPVGVLMEIFSAWQGDNGPNS